MAKDKSALVIEIPKNITQLFSDTITVMHHDANSFTMFIATKYPEHKKIIAHARVWVPPPVVKELAQVLTRAVQQYEAKFGAIPVPKRAEPQEGEDNVTYIYRDDKPKTSKDPSSS
jgi:hypothetical protein